MNKKPVELIEKHVQWAVLGLAVAFAGAVVYLFVVDAPTVSVGGKAMGGGEIDKATLEGPAEKLKEAVDNTAAPEFPAKDVLTPFKTALANKPSAPDALAGGWLGMPLRPLGISGSVPVGPAPEQLVQALVAALPALPPPSPEGVSLGLSQVNVGGLAGGAAGGQVPPAGGPAAVALQTRDVQWVTVGFSLPMGEISDAFRQANFPPGLRTEFLAIEVEREELNADGAWVNSTVIKPLSTSRLAALPAIAGGKLRDEQLYSNWASKHQPDILQPGFYPVLGGTPWAVPGTQVGPTTQKDAGAFDPNKYLTGPIPAALTPDEKRQVEEARKREEAKRKDDERRRAADARNRRPSTPPPGIGRPPGGSRGPGGPGGPGGPPGSGGRQGPRSYTPAPTSLAEPSTGGGAGLTQEKSDRDRMMPPPGSFPTPLGQNPANMGPPPGSPMPQPGEPVVIARAAGETPKDSFDPLGVGGLVEAWAHDETVEPGKTYRYRGRYVLRNPVHNLPNAVSLPELATRFGIASEWSAWGEDVTTGPRVRFFVAGRISPGNPTVGFQVFRFKDGAMRMEAVRAAPGDLIGASVGTGEFGTGFTLVDIRQDARTAGTWYAVVMDPSGRLSLRDAAGDEKNPDYQRLQQDAARPPAPPAAGR